MPNPLTIPLTRDDLSAIAFALSDRASALSKRIETTENGENRLILERAEAEITDLRKRVLLCLGKSSSSASYILTTEEPHD